MNPTGFIDLGNYLSLGPGGVRDASAGDLD